ncbi:hypothetical protein [Halotalea alkalilenta]|uniref:hypothetical protein n=1 Tax=Halotalea alkalilenta TaxID=376489 RepID=UPI0012373982|nr:hypothetical protein [Halotalea alkalilenta]
MEWEFGSLFIDHLRINTDFVPDASMTSIVFSAKDKKIDQNQRSVRSSGLAFRKRPWEESALMRKR